MQAGDATQLRSGPVENSDQLKVLGFEPSALVFEVAHPHTAKVTIAQVQRALFDTTYSHPISLQIPVWASEGAVEIVTMVPILAQAVFTPNYTELDPDPLGYLEAPSWYVRGFLPRRDADPHPGSVHLLLQSLGVPGDGLEGGLLQHVRRPSSASRSADLCWAYPPTS
jgi:hypothetical protein